MTVSQLQQCLQLGELSQRGAHLFQIAWATSAGGYASEKPFQVVDLFQLLTS